MQILIVDDNQTNRKLLRITLEAERYATIEAEDGIAALAALAGQPIDLIVSDVLMPNMDGFSLCSEVRRQSEFDRIPFLLYTASDLTVEDERLGAVLGADRFLKKQGTPGVILRAIQEILEEPTPRRRAQVQPAGELPPEKVMKQYNELLIRRLEEKSIELEQTRDELRLVNRDLEKRVEERTRELREKNEQMEEDLKMAHELQMAMLPNVFPNFPRDALPRESAIKFSSFFYPKESVSGDFFSVSRRSDSSVEVLIADVMGHGVRAGLITAMIRALLEKLSAASPDPSAMLSGINQSLFQIFAQTGITLFSTAFYLVADLQRSRMSFANAGHPAPLFLHRRRGELEQMSSNGAAGPALGLFNAAKYRTCEAPLEVDDLIMLFTDGLFEVEAPDHELYTSERLLRAVRPRMKLESSELFAQLFAEIRQFSKRPDFSDDVCLLGMEVARLGGN
jgi:serine phosphatase RsbU (regulator of sigma subunit)/CheY-like chemotaxis protein